MLAHMRRDKLSRKESHRPLLHHLHARTRTRVVLESQSRTLLLLVTRKDKSRARPLSKAYHPRPKYALLIDCEHSGQPAIQTLAPMSQISDGQLQIATATMVMMPVANQIHDGQIQLQTTMAQVTQFEDGQPQAPTFTAAPTQTVSAVGQQSDAQPTAAVASQPSSSTAAPAPSSASANSGNKMITCSSGFSIQLENGVLTDQDGRTGYIASNYQLQFDKPPQAGAIYTAGFSECSNGSLALGGSSIFYQCLSGKFYNLYDRSWAAQCSPVYIDTLRQVAC